MNKKYVDKNGLCYYMKDAEIESPVEYFSVWFGWLKRWCYVVGGRVFIARNCNDDPKEMINLLEYGTSVSLLKDKDQTCCLISCCKKKGNVTYKLKFLKRTNESCVEHLQRTITIERLRKGEPVEISDCPYKYLCVPFLTDWLSVKDLVVLDSSLCNQSYRRMYLFLLQEYSHRFSKTSFNFPLTLSTKALVWLLNRHVVVSALQIRDSSLLSIVLEHKIYSFAHVTELLYESDTDVFYNLMQHCTQLKALTIYGIQDYHRFISCLIVHNRQLESIQCNPRNYPIRSLHILALHHRNLSILPKCGLLTYRTGLWYQRPPNTLTIHYHTLEQIKELCQRTTEVLTFSYPTAENEIAETVLRTQQSLESVNLVLSYGKVTGIPVCLSRCSCLVSLSLTRSLNPATPSAPAFEPLDWSCFRESSMRLHTLTLFMANEDILQYMTDVLSTATSLTISNHMVTDEQMLSIFRSNRSRLREFSVLNANQLTGQFLYDVGLHCHRLTKLYLGPKLTGLKRIDLETMCGYGSKQLAKLFVPSKLFSLESIVLLMNGYPALRYLYLDCNDNALSVKDVGAVLTILGSQLIELGLEYSADGFKNTCRALRSDIDRCCDIV